MYTKAKEFLQSAKRAEALIQSDIDELERLRGMIGSLQTAHYGSRVQSSRRSEAEFTALVDKMTDIEERLNDEIDAYVDRKEEIRKSINQLSNTEERLCLKLRYIDFCSWPVIADKMNYSERQIYRLHDRALSKLVFDGSAEKTVNF